MDILKFHILELHKRQVDFWQKIKEENLFFFLTVWWSQSWLDHFRDEPKQVTCDLWTATNHFQHPLGDEMCTETEKMMV